MALGWPVGEVLGSEADLLERYHVSRAVFREAVRLLEHQQVARTRRGPGGGLVITEPTVGAVSDAVVLYLHRVDATLDEIFEARIILEELACQLAAERTDEADLAALRRFVEEGPMEPGGDLAGCTCWWPRSAATPDSSCSSTSSTGWPSSTHRTGNTSGRHSAARRACPRQDRRGRHGRRCRPGPQSHAEASRGGGGVLPPPPLHPPAPAGLGRAGGVGPGQGCRGGGAPHHADRRGGGSATGRSGRDRARADRPRGREPGPAPRSGAAAGVPPHRTHAARPGRRPLRHGPERQRRHGDGRHLPGPPRHDARRAGRAAHRRRGGDHRLGGAAHRRRGHRGHA